jgi:excisionase family DNA binding protein
MNKRKIEEVSVVKKDEAKEESSQAEKFYLTSEVEEILNISKSTLKRLIKSGKIRAVKFGEDVQGNPWHISESSLEEYKKMKSTPHYNIKPAQ